MNKSASKILLGLFYVGFLLCGLLYADMVVPASSLPQNAQSFISNNFKDATVVYVEQDFDDFEVRLSNGVKIDFYRDGNWKEIENYNGIDLSLLPTQVSKTVQTTYPNVLVLKIEKEWSGYEVKLANMLKVYINEKGQIVGQKHDD